MSEHEVKVIEIDSIEAHTNADALEIVNVWGYSCVVRKGQFKVGDLAAFIEPDYCVEIARPEFSFLQSSKAIHRITVKRLRGVYSYGLLIPAPRGSKKGDNVMELLGVTRWEPQLNRGQNKHVGSSGLAMKGPELPAPKYDLENIRKYNRLIDSNDEVFYTAKLHGCNLRAVYHNGQMYCGSRNVWKKSPGFYFTLPKRQKPLLWFCCTLLPFLFGGNATKASRVLNWFAINFMFFGLPFGWLDTLITRTIYEHKPDIWWSALKQNPWLETWCRLNPDVVVYGEVVGPLIQGKDFHYGFTGDQLGVFLFDILEDGKWLSNVEFSKPRFADLKFVPVVYSGPFDRKIMETLAEETETFNNAGHIREGIVIKLHNERIDTKIGRVALKYVSNNYFEHS